MIHYSPLDKTQRRVLACVAAAEIHTPADYDLTTSDLHEMHPKNVSRKRIVSALRYLEDEGYVFAGTHNVFANAENPNGLITTWKITTLGLRAALGVLS